MTHPKPYNPLDLSAIAHNIETALLQQTPQALPPESKFEGAGIYAIYYVGQFPPYLPISDEECSVPIYVGRALPPGARQGKVGIGEPAGPVLYSRLTDHAKSIRQAENIELSDFRCRFLVVEDLFVSLGERLTIAHFTPLWNQIVGGFGNHNPGKGRHAGKRSDWDVLHPGRPWAEKLEDGRDLDDVEAMVEEHFTRDGAATAPEGSTTNPIPPAPAAGRQPVLAPEPASAPEPAPAPRRDSE